MALGDPHERREHLAAVDRARRIVRIDHDERARARRDQRLERHQVRVEVLRLGARIVDRLAAVEHRRGGPERVIRARDQHLVANVEQAAQREVDELAHAVAHEHVVGAHVRDAAALLLHHDRFAGREDALLVAVGLARGEVLDHREPHRLGRAQPEEPRIADVQLDDLVALMLELERAPRELAADLVADVFELRADLDVVRMA